MSVRLNIGAGATEIEGFTSVDRKTGLEAYPLGYEDDSVDEIRASHILEHFPFADVPKVLADWARVLKPGGRMRIAVPDFSKCVRVADRDQMWSRYIMGGQTDENDFHKSLWTEPDLRQAMTDAGLTDLQPWTSDNTDCASLPISLNIEGVKGTPKEMTVKIAAIMSVPRVGWNDCWGQVLEALAPLRIPVRRFSGVYWGQCMQRLFEGAVADGLDWILTIDYDSMFTTEHVSMLMDTMGQNPEIDAVAGLQAKRQSDLPLMTCGDTDKQYSPDDRRVIEVTGEPIKVTTAHFGLTLLRVEPLAKLPKPWFFTEPCEDGTYGHGHLDDDIWFWHQWRKAGRTIYVDPKVRIGHLEVMVHEYDEQMEGRFVDVVKWRVNHGYLNEAQRKCKESDSNEPGECPAADASTPAT